MLQESLSEDVSETILEEEEQQIDVNMIVNDEENMKQDCLQQQNDTILQEVVAVAD